MTRVVGVHGIRKYHYFANNGRSAELAATAISADWSTWLSYPSDRLQVAYYAHLLHRGAPQGAADDPAMLTPTAQGILVSLVDELIGTPRLAQGERTAGARAAADWLTRHCGAVTRAVVLAFCREVDTYLSDQRRRVKVRDAVATAVRAHEPTVLIAHSLGSVVAYETLWAHRDLAVDLLITIGSPLALPKAVFPRLVPGPVDERGARPPGARCWINMADVGDVVAIPRGGLGDYFSGVKDVDVVIGKTAFHSAQYYLGCADLRRLLSE